MKKLTDLDFKTIQFGENINELKSISFYKFNYYTTYTPDLLTKYIKILAPGFWHQSISFVLVKNILKLYNMLLIITNNVEL